MNPLRVLVIGASCQVGRFLLPLLRSQGVEAHALSRQPPVADDDGAIWHRGALPDALPELPSLDGIISFGPMDALAGWLARFDTRPAPGLVATSSMSVVSKRDSVVDGERALVARLEAGEQALQRECARLGMAWALIRPTLIYGAGLDRSLSPIARRAMRWRVFPLPRAEGWRQPVHAADVAEAAWRALCLPEAAGRVFELGGGERLRAGEMFARVRDSLPRATLRLPVCGPALALLARLVPAARGPVSRLGSDLVADNAQAQAVLGVEPRPFSPDAATWAPPGSGAQR